MNTSATSRTVGTPPHAELRFSALPAHVRTARLVAVAMARRAGVEEGALDEVRLAVGEACSRAVALHRVHCPDELVTVELGDSAGRFVVRVLDQAGDLAEGPLAPAGDEIELVDPAEPDDAALPPGIGLAVIAGLVEDVEVRPGPDGGAVQMSWPCQGGLAGVVTAP